MKIFIAGATGVLGRRLVTFLKAKGHTVIGLARRSENEETLRALGAEPRTADLFNADQLSQAADGCQVVIHAATSIPMKHRVSLPDFALNDRIRTEGCSALASAASKVGAHTFVFQSILEAARPLDGSAFDESMPADKKRPISGTAAIGEATALDWAGQTSGHAMVFRGGWFYSADAGHTQGMAKALRAGKLPIMGPGDNWLRIIHADDMAQAIVLALDKPKTGIWHVADDRPVTLAEFLTGFARRLGAAVPPHIPTWLAGVLAGRHTADLMTRTTQTGSTKLKRDFDWAPRYPSYREGLDQIVQEWAKAGG